MYCINRSRASDSYTLQLCFPDTFLLQKRFYQFCHIPYDVLIRSLYIRRHRCFCNYMLLFVNNPCFYIGSTKINSCSVHFFLTQSVMILIILTLSIYWFQRKKSNSNFKNTRHDRLLIFHRDCMILIDAHMLCLFHRIYHILPDHW